MILEAGEFNVADYRKAIPCNVKIQVMLDTWLKFAQATNGVFNPETVQFFDKAADIQFDHSPALTNRQYDTDAGDFIPPQHDPKYIVPLLKENHLYKTVGRKPGAEKTVTTRGSDVGERSRVQDIRASNAVHLARIAAKSGNQVEVDSILASARFKKKHLRTKRKIPQRRNPWG